MAKKDAVSIAIANENILLFTTKTKIFGVFVRKG
jgi:hypothetical protein